MKKIFFIVLVIFLSLDGADEGNLYAQEKQGQSLIDSLLQELPKQKEDTNKINLLDNLSYAFVDVNPEEMKKYAETAMYLSKKLNYKKGIGKAFTNIGDVYMEQSNYSEALKNYFAGLKNFEEVGDKKGISCSFAGIGVIYYRQGNYPEALKNQFASLKIDEEIGNKSNANLYLNIGVVFFDQGNYPEALKYYFEALKISDKIGNKRCTAISYLNIGNIYNAQGNYLEALKNYFTSLKIFQEIGNKSGIAISYVNIGTVYSLQSNYPEALKYYFETLKIFEEMGDKNGISSSYNNIGEVYMKQNKYTEALKIYFKVLKICEEIGDKIGISKSYNNVGSSYINLKKYSLAQNNIDKGLAIAKVIGSLYDIKLGYESLTKLDSTMDNWEGAYNNNKLAIQYRDSVFNKEKDKKLIQSQMQYDFDKKEAVAKVEQEKKDAIAVKELQRQKLVRNGFGGGFAVVLVFAGIFFSQRNKIKEGKKKSDELLLNILPAEVAEELKAKGSADAMLIDDVTVLFTDFKGFTQLSEKLSPQALVAEINACFSAFDHIMQKYGVEKIKTIGDAYMAAGGLPTPNQTHATDVVNAAVAIQNYMAQHKADKEAKNELYFEIRIGVHTGPVVAGIVGIKKFQYDIWGDTVNTASRMESSGEVGKVNISGSTFALVKEKFNCVHRGKIIAKGKGEVDMYFVG